MVVNIEDNGDQSDAKKYLRDVLDDDPFVKIELIGFDGFLSVAKFAVEEGTVDLVTDSQAFYEMNVGEIFIIFSDNSFKLFIKPVPSFYQTVVDILVNQKIGNDV